MVRFVYIFVLFTCFSFSQKEYAFDYLLEYETDSTEGKTVKKSTFYYMTNSENNDYVAQFFTKDSLSFSIDFIEMRRCNAHSFFPKTGLLKSENILIPCEYINKQTGIPSDKSAKYSVNVLKDTLIDGITYSVFEYRYLDKKREKRKKLNHEVYFVDKNTSFHQPIKYNYLFTAENELQKLPKGIVAKRLVVSYDNKIISEQKLVRYVKVDKKIALQICD